MRWKLSEKVHLIWCFFEWSLIWIWSSFSIEALCSQRTIIWRRCTSADVFSFQICFIFSFQIWFGLYGNRLCIFSLLRIVFLLKFCEIILQSIQGYHHYCHIIECFLVECKFHNIFHSFSTKLMNIFKLSLISTQSIPYNTDDLFIR